MIYGQDEPTLFPVADLYDSGMIQMYINAAREQYNQNREDLKEFQKTFGDFVSPFAKDAQWVDANTRGRINEAMDYLQKNGIDPLRSAEGRAVLQRVINTTPRAEINIRRANAKLGEEYLKARGQMMANGTYNDDYEQYLLNNLGLGRFEDFDSSMGTWTRTSPSQFKDLNAATSSWFDDLKGEDLGLDPTGRYRLYGVDENQMNRSLTPMLPGFVHNDLGGYYYNLAKKELQSSGQLNPTEDQILDRLKSNIVTANKERMFVRADADDYTKLQIQNQYARDLENLRTQNNIYEDMITNGADENGDGKISKEEKQNYSKLAKLIAQREKGKIEDSIFDEADLRIDNIGDEGVATYTPSNSLYHKIGVVNSSIQYMPPEKNKTGISPAMYIIPKNVAKNVVFLQSDVDEGDLLYTSRNKYGKNIKSPAHPVFNKVADENVYFMPKGGLRAVQDGNKIRYFISGEIYSDRVNEKGEVTKQIGKNGDNSSTYYMEVTRQQKKYGESSVAKHY